MRFTSQDAEIHYEILGEGPDLVLLHPFPTNHRFWMGVADMLASRYRMIAYDLRGHGDSTPGSGPATMEKHAADLARLCEVNKVSKAIFAGVSIGGYVLLDFWRRHGERVAALILSDTRATADTEEGRAARLKSAEEVQKNGPATFLEGMVPKLLGQHTRDSRPDVVEGARKMMAKTTGAGIVALQQGMAARPDSVPTLATINVPTLVLVGAEDTLTPPADAELIHQGIAGSRLEVIPLAGHLAIYEQRNSAGKVIREFLDDLKP
ncbi:MAG: alpha/beta hydrolase [Acidobacteriota bacterium]|nr:alpha/beta hydrolase [Acidobacteriota bacterium]